ncbi:MAG: PASTA domain-containing protein [Cyclobacteriaceae bacterium]|nr:PASTA domain-containing protein [Cyclobacteriaceae bacterium]MCH8517150.1 PASTA domain-containing protein [Cyclobacteriaceae bacterium]
MLRDFFRINSFKKALIHLGVMLSIAFLAILIFFLIYLPSTTKHGETLTVPDLEGIVLEELDQYLQARNLRYEVNIDSGFSSEFPPYAVLNHYPMKNTKVKEGRKIYVTLNAAQPPKVKMPNLIDGSVKNAQMVLSSYGLIRGELIYKPDLIQNSVLDQLYEGKPIEEGSFVPKGAKIDLVVGDGMGKQTLGVPDATGFDLDEAEFLITGSGLNVGAIVFVSASETNQRAGTVVKQEPESGQEVRIGSVVDLWVVEYDDSLDLGLDEDEI